MITEVREVVDLISHHLGELNNKFPIIRKEQSAKKPAYPFGAYKLLSLGGSHYDNKKIVENPNPIRITERYSKTNTAVVSLSFYISENTTSNPLGTPLTIAPIDVIYDLAERAIDFLQKIGSEKFQILGVVVELLNSNVTDRTTYLESIYEYQVGFDFKVKLEKELDVEVDTINMPLSIDEIVVT